MYVQNLFVCISVVLCLVFRFCRLSNLLFHLSYRTSITLQNFILMVVSTASHIPCHCKAGFTLVLLLVPITSASN